MTAYRCQWCQHVLSHTFNKCQNPTCDRPPGWRLDAPLGTGKVLPARSIQLTPLGWETAGYVRDGAGWRKP